MTTTTRRLCSSLALLTLSFGLHALSGCVVEAGTEDGDRPNPFARDELPIRTPGPGDVTDPGDPGDPNGSKDPPVDTPDDPPVDTPDDPPVDDPPVDEPPPEPTMMASTRNNLVWKRYRAVERDLMRGLELTKEELCNELGQYNCIDAVHLAPLGGNEPFDLGQYEPVGSPTATTATALDRVVLSACVARVDEDRSNNPEVFVDLDLNQAQVGAADAAAIDATTTTLYRRLLSRDPIAEELAAIRSMADAQTLSGAELATLACYAIGTTVENFFY